MARKERLAKLQQWLAEGLAGEGVTSARAQRELGVSRATLTRDMAYLRNGLGLGVIWSPGRRAWTLNTVIGQREGQQFLVDPQLSVAGQGPFEGIALASPAQQINNAKDGRPGSHSPLAGSARSGETSPPLGEHSAQRGAQHGAGRRTGRSGAAGSRTRTPAHATRYLETQLGRLSYLELAPHLVGWRRSEVLVGTHTPPAAYQIALLMNEYTLDLQARIAATPPDSERIFETLAFAEGRLLSIHPFADFNGRVSRLFLRLLLRRLDLPDVDIVPDPFKPEPYFEALRAGDLRDWRPLTAPWRHRIARAQGQQAL